MATDVTLEVNGQRYGGWKTIQITRGIKAVSGGFSLEVSEKWNGQEIAWPIQIEDECTLRIGRVPVITGWVDKRKHAYDDKSHTLTFTGRDKTGALVDSSAVMKKWEFVNVPILDYVTMLAKPFGIVVSLQPGIADKAISTAPASKRGSSGGAPNGVGTAGKNSAMSIGKPVAKLHVSQGDSPFEAIERACRLAGVLPVADGLGGLVLTRTGGLRATTALDLRTNILSGSADYDSTGRYRTYIVSGQQTPTADIFGPAAVAVSGTALDLGVRRADRVLVIRPGNSVTSKFASQRAAWESTVRKARSATVSYVVQGWTQQPGGDLWPVNALVSVYDPRLGIEGDMLITQVVHALTLEGGTTSTIELAYPDSFLPEPVIDTSTKSGGGALSSILG